MRLLIGLLIVIGSVVGGYIMAHGNLSVLMQPAEFVIILGAAGGSFIIATPFHTISKVFKTVLGFIIGKGTNRTAFMDVLRVLYELSLLARKEGLLAIESHAENPNESGILKKLSHRKELVEFVCDALRLILAGFHTDELAEALRTDIETREEESHEPGEQLSAVADSLPGLGIVAAVLGIIITMGSIGGDASAVGLHVASALVGTFLGVLMCYGVVGPIASIVKQEMAKHILLFKVAQSGILALSNGTHPMMLCEMARRSIPDAVRPSFRDLEKAFTGAGGE